MPFSTSFCLTNIGSLPSNTTLSFYSNADGYTVPFQTTVPLFSVTGNNCPFILNGVYDGTTIIKVESSIGSCCAVINISPNDPCTFCNLGFDVFSASTIGRIVAGNLTGSCSANITDYVIEWYETSNPNTIVFTSGQGTEFEPYGYPHPLTGINSYLVTPGIYKPYLRKVRLNGINYSYTGGTGTVQADLDCFETISVTVSPLTCSNGTLINDNYTHQIEFSGASQGIIPSTIQQVFQLSPDTNYFAWRFWGYDIPDTLKITYYGSNYNNTPIILDYWSVGNNNTFNTTTSLTSFPKVSKTSNISPDRTEAFNKVICLTGITRSINDYLIIDIIPNQLNNKTNFKLKTKCLISFNCDTCFDNFYNNSMKIIQNSINYSEPVCNKVVVNLRLSGCSETQLSTSDLHKYSKTETFVEPKTMDYPGTSWGNGQYVINTPFQRNSSLCNGRVIQTPGNNFCGPSGTTVITFTKDNSGPGGIGKISMTFTNLSDFNAYYNSYLSTIIAAGGVPTDPTIIEWYRYIVLTTPEPTGPNDPCGDTTSFRTYNIHPTSVVTTGQTSSTYTMSLTMPIITDQISFNTCEVGCDAEVNSKINIINTSSNSASYSYENYASNRIQNPFNFVHYSKIITSTDDNFSVSYNVIYSKILNETIPFSANTNGTFSYIPSLSAVTCSFINYYRTSPIPATGELKYVRSYGQLRGLQRNPLNITDFIIEMTPITQGMYPYIMPVAQPTNLPLATDYVYVYQNVNGVGTVLEPSYFT
jgi:hypothetical protein